MSGVGASVGGWFKKDKESEPLGKQEEEASLCPDEKEDQCATKETADVKKKEKDPDAVSNHSG